MQAYLAASPAAAGSWAVLRARAQACAGGLAVPPQPREGLCASCRGPVLAGCARCYHCSLHAESAPGLLADVVAPAAYAPKGSELARDLWVYKSPRPDARRAGRNLLALLLVFLHEQGPGIWERAGMAGPTHACMVPSGRGRPGPHPLQALLARYLGVPWAALVPRVGSDPWGRTLDPGRFRALRRLPGTSVLLLDDTWTSGGSAQSAAVALKRAGARSVAVVVAGRHVTAAALPGLAGPPAGAATPGSRRSLG